MVAVDKVVGTANGLQTGLRLLIALARHVFANVLKPGRESIAIIWLPLRSVCLLNNCH